MRIGLITQSNAHESSALTWLGERLADEGHDITAVAVPELEGDLEHQLSAVQACLDLDVSAFDLVISSSSPGWLVSHPRHLVYSSGDCLQHTDHAAHPRLERCDDIGDLVSTARQILTEADLAEGDANGQLASDVHQRLDQLVLTTDRITQVAAFSEFAAEAFEDAGHEAPILVSPPVPATGLGQANTPPRLVVFSQSSFDGDRVQLLIDSFATIDDPHAELRIAGDGRQRRSIEDATADRRVRFLGAIDDDELPQELITASSAVILTQNTGWSHVGVKALRAGVPLITPSDAGGITEVVEHGVNGLVVEPSEARVAWAIRHIHSSPRLRWQLGLAAQRRGAELDSDRLLDQVDDLLAPHERPRALTLSTYPVDPMVGGGQRRARFQSRSMADRCDVTVLVNTSRCGRIRRRLVEVGLTQVEIPKSTAQIDAELDIFHAMDRTPVDDITASRLAAASPLFGRELERQLATADLVIGTQPFLIPVLPPDTPPIVHDSQNIEAALKADLLPDSAGGRWLLDEVRRVESEAGRRAAIVTACTENDAAGLTNGIGTSAAPTIVVGNGVDTTALPFKTLDEHARSRDELLAVCDLAPNDDRPIGLFIGSWHPPNISAARLLLDLATARPDWIFILAGSHTSEFAGELLPDNVHLIAVFAESLLWPLLAGADVALNPMRSGGGSNLKLFDYLAVGTPIVSTPTGARGLTEPERHCILAEPSVGDFSRAIDQARREAITPTGVERAAAGRRLVEEVFDWQLLGDAWSDGILSTLGIAPGPLRHRRLPARRPVLSDSPPPSNDPVIATIQLLGLQARLTPPSPQEVSMDPALRERLKRANDNRNIGRELPANARFTAPKKALIRVGHALTNEQVIYNQAIVEAVEQLAVSMRSLESEHRDLQRTVEELTAENRALKRQLEALE